ncbi:Uncharacterised protein [Bordetella bronchiseptica]|nr:Uncharacterised protein [Bordetella bronchiseptica]
MVQLPSAARLSGNNRPACSAACCTACSTQPASTVIVSLSVSMARTRFSRVVDSTTALPLSSGVAPPHRPVLPPCGTSGAPCAWHNRTTAATSSALPGRATASARPR